MLSRGEDFELVKSFGTGPVGWVRGVQDSRHLLYRGKPRDRLADKCAARGEVCGGLIVDTMQIDSDDWVPALVQPGWHMVHVQKCCIEQPRLSSWCSDDG